LLYLKKILNEYGYIKLMNKNDYSKRQRGSNDIFSMILSIILLLGNEFLRIEMLKELEIFINKENKEKNLSIEEIMNNVYQHVGSIDYHDPFEDKEIIDVINSLPIKYLVFELIGDTREELEDKIQRQWKIFN